MKLTKRGKIWWIDYRANGKRHRQSTGTADKAVAKAFMEQIDVARRMPTFEAAVAVLRQFYPEEAPQGMIPLSGIWETYTRLAAAVGKDKLSHDTIRGRRNHVERLIAWIQEKRATVKFAEHVTGPIAAGFAEYLGQDLKLKTKTRRNIIGDLSTVWNTLEKASAGVRNPWLHLAPPDTDGRRGLAFSRDQERAVLFDKWLRDRYEPYQLQSLDDYEEFKRRSDAKTKSQSQFVRERLMRNVTERSNGESALLYFTDSIRENALYLLDEPENSLSAARQQELRAFLEQSARFFGCQFIIATHSPLLLSLEGAKIYDLDENPVEVRDWWNLESVRLYQQFFEEHRALF